jgi:hypothetical protein
MLQLTENRIKRVVYFILFTVFAWKTEIEKKEFIIYIIRQMLLGSTSQEG